MSNPIKDTIARAMKSHCANCKLSRYAERKPRSFISKIWHWHSKWCPMRKAYLRDVAKQE